MNKISLVFHSKNKGKSHIAVLRWFLGKVFRKTLDDRKSFRRKYFSASINFEYFSRGNLLSWSRNHQKRRCVICLCFYNEKSMEFWSFSWNPHFSHFFTKKWEKSTFLWKVHFFAKKSEKCTFSWKSPKSALFALFAPLARMLL